MDPDLPLVRALQSGDDSALNTLMDRHRETVFSFSYRYLHNETSARDVAQEVFVRAYFKAGKFKPTAAVKTWLFTIALNLCRDHIRKSATRREGYSLDAPRMESNEPNALHDPALGPVQMAEKRDQNDVLRRAIDALPERLREAIILFSLEGKSQQESAEILGITPKTIELRVYHAKQKLKTLLGR